MNGWSPGGGKQIEASSLMGFVGRVFCSNGVREFVAAAGVGLTYINWRHGPIAMEAWVPYGESYGALDGSLGPNWMEAWV